MTGALATLTERERFRREARLAARLNHRNIVPIVSVHDQDGILFFTMKLIDGGNLAQLACQFKEDPRLIARLIKTLAGAVHHAHGHGFIHCDLKPSNILIDQDGEPQITDFGLARLASDDSSLTATGAILGTPSYMAPEQASGQRKSIGPATDVYGLGAILYELLTGRPPFRTSSMMETVVQVLERDPVPPREIHSWIPRELETICLKCLEKMPQERYPSAQALADDLERFLQGDVVEATGVLQNLKRWTRREPEAVSRLGGLALVALLTEANHQIFRPTARQRNSLWRAGDPARLGDLGDRVSTTLAEGLAIGQGPHAVVDGRPHLLDHGAQVDGSREQLAAGGLPAHDRRFRAVVSHERRLVHDRTFHRLLSAALCGLGPSPSSRSNRAGDP